MKGNISNRKKQHLVKNLTREGQRRATAKSVKAAVRECKRILGACIKPKVWKSLNPGDQQRVAEVRGSLTNCIEGFWSEVRQ